MRPCASLGPIAAAAGLTAPVLASGGWRLTVGADAAAPAPAVAAPVGAGCAATAAGCA
jgi:hypothetical protein